MNHNESYFFVLFKKCTTTAPRTIYTPLGIQIINDHQMPLKHPHTHIGQQTYKMQHNAASSFHSAIRKSRTSRIRQRIRSERWVASFASRSSWPNTFLIGGPWAKKHLSGWQWSTVSWVFCMVSMTRNGGWLSNKCWLNHTETQKKRRRIKNA